jgi:hypothetical protein
MVIYFYSKFFYRSLLLNFEKRIDEFVFSMQIFVCFFFDKKTKLLVVSLSMYYWFLLQ